MSLLVALIKDGRAWLGMTSAWGGFWLTFVEAIDWTIRISAGCIGIAIGVYTLLIKVREYRKLKSSDG